MVCCSCTEEQEEFYRSLYFPPYIKNYENENLIYRKEINLINIISIEEIDEYISNRRDR